MRLHRFFVDQEIGVQTEISIDSALLVNQVRRVFRLKIGDSIVVFNGTGNDYECKIDGFGEKSTIDSDSVIRLLVSGSEKSRYAPVRTLFLCAAVVKKDTFEWITEKATELGVTDLIPIMAERSEKKSLNESRLRKIAIEASEQSGRGTTPMVHEIMGLGEAAAFLKKGNPEIQCVAFHTEEGSLRMSDIRKRLMSNVGKNRMSDIRHNLTSDVRKNRMSDIPLAVFIGPEGGWSEDEIDLFHKNDIPVVCLGPQVLRAETAAIAALSQVVFD